MFRVWKFFVALCRVTPEPERPVIATCACCGNDIRDDQIVRHHLDDGAPIPEGAVRWSERWSVACMSCAEMPCDGTGRLKLEHGNPIARSIPFEQLYA